MSEVEGAPAIRYHNNKITVLTESEDEGAIVYTGRLFDAEKRILQSTKELVRIPIESTDFDASETSYYHSPDSAFLLIVVNTGKFEDSKEYKDMGDFRTQLIVVNQDSMTVHRRNVTVSMQESPIGNIEPSFGVNNQGDILYATYRIVNKNNIQQMLIRLPAQGGTPDTLFITAAQVVYHDEQAFPTKALINILTNDSVSLAWKHNVDNKIACVSIGKFDFASHTVSASKNLVLTEEEIEGLVDNDELKSYRLLRFIHLGEEGSLLVLDEQKFEDAKIGRERTAFESSNPLRSGYVSDPTVIGQYSVAGPLIVVKLDGEGNVVWKSSIKKRKDKFNLGHNSENYPAMSLTNNSLRMLYRTRSDIKGITYMEFMLNDGEVRTAELPISYAQFALFFPRATQWNHDDQVLIVGREHFVGQLIKIKLPPTQYFVQE